MPERRTGFFTRLAHGWNAFRDKDQEIISRQDIGPAYYGRPDRIPLRPGTERTIVASIITRIGIDVSSVRIQHARLDKNERFIDVIDSDLNYCLNTEANIDQTSRAFFQDVAESLCDEGTIAVVPEETTLNPNMTAGFDIKSMRVAKILQWYPEHIRVQMYDMRDGQKKEITLPKRFVAIIQNPLYNVMNEPNSTLKRLIHKLALLDLIDERSGSDKLNLIVHLPYGAKTQVQADSIRRRRKELEKQIKEGEHGIVYMDAAEKVTQLNRPIENKLMEQIEYLTSMLYSQLGITKEILDGTADEKVMLNYFSRTIEPIVSAICDEFNRKFLSKTARSQNQKIVFFRDLIKLAPLDSIVNAGRDFTSSEIMTPNEVRQWIGLKPAPDAGADELRNRYVNASPGMGEQEPMTEEYPEEPEIGQTRVSQIRSISGSRGNLASMKVSELG